MNRRIKAITFGGALTSTAAALLLGRIRRGAWGPGVNCTAHWFHGDDAAHVPEIDGRHSLVGAGTNAAAVLFWAWFYDRALGQRPGLVRALIVTMALGPVSCLIDYKATPKRFTPGWELVFSKADMALIYLAMVLGMAGGAMSAGADQERVS